MKTKTLECRYGTFTFYPDDDYVGRSLDLYGEYSEDEVRMMSMALRPGDVAIDIGSNIGSLTVPMAKLVGPEGKIFAFEPQPENFTLLKKNIWQNELQNVKLYMDAVGSEETMTKIPHLNELKHTNFGGIEIGEGSALVPMVKIDHYHFDKLRFIKIDAEGSELDILRGAKETIKKHRPIIYFENDRQDKSAELTGWLIDQGYRLWSHKIPLFSSGNYFGNPKNVFTIFVSSNVLGVPEELGSVVKGLREIDDNRNDPERHKREFYRKLRLLEINPKDLDSKYKAAHYANLNGDADLAMKMLQENLELDPEHIPTRFLKGFLDLQAGRFEEGWAGYELRYKYKDRMHEKYELLHDKVPYWDGSLTDEVVLVHSEQGYGDTIMFCRFMDEVLKRAPNAILEVPPVLYEIIKFSRLVPEDRLFRVQRTLPRYTLHCSLPSLPFVLQLNDEKQFDRGAYLRSDTKMINSWKNNKINPRIGMCLNGNPQSERAYSRDMPEDLMGDLIKTYGPVMDLANKGQFESYMDTAAAIMSLDMVFTVDTSVAHLAGALGAPVTLMLAFDGDFRWQKNRSDSPWYPTMKILRQKEYMDWSPVLEGVEEILIGLNKDMYKYQYNTDLKITP